MLKKETIGKIKSDKIKIKEIILKIF